MSNPFFKQASEYQRDINPLKHYVEDAVTYLMTMTQKPQEVCREFVVRSLQKGNVFEFKDAKVVYLEREENGDRVKKEGYLSQYISESVKNNDIIAPTFTTYVNPHIKKSLLAIDIDDGITHRNVAKKEMFVAKAAGNKLKETMKKTEQTNRKLGNNAVSGAQATASTPLVNKTGHSTLTSICRSTSGYGNANNEKLLSGNRHYYNYSTVVNNIVSIVGHTDYAALNAALLKYGLVYPDVEQTMTCILYSSSVYWKTPLYIEKLRRIVEKLSAEQRAAFVYTGDLYHVMLFNNDFMRKFIGKLSDKVYGTCEDPLGIIKKAEDATLNLAHQICTEETMGIGKDYSSILNTEKIHTLACTVRNIDETVQAYAQFIQTIMVTSNLPASVGYFPDSIRLSAITSDTDSTIFTVQDWVVWYVGKISFSPRAIAVQAAMTYIASSSIIHVLATMSANLGIVTEHMFRVAMKSEFRFDVFVPTQIGKTYYAAIGCQEGNVFKEHEIEIKGVQLKSSNVPAVLNKKAKAMMVEIMKTVMAEKKISLTYWLNYVAEVEREIIASVKKGETTYLRTGSIKDAASYTKTAEESPYQNHRFWQEVFGPKYAVMIDPPYMTAKISLTTENPTLFKEWLANIPDKALAERMTRYMAAKGKTSMTTFHAPIAMLERFGIPEEFMPVVDFNKIAGELCKSFYLILETLGVYTSENKVKRLISDFY